MELRPNHTGIERRVPIREFGWVTTEPTTYRATSLLSLYAPLYLRCDV